MTSQSQETERVWLQSDKKDEQDGGRPTEMEEDKERQMEKKLKIQVGAGGGGCKDRERWN